MNATRAVVDGLYAAFLAGDADGMLELMDDEVEVRFLGQASLRGKTAAARFFSFAGGLLVDVDFRIRDVVIDGDVAAVTWDETARTRGGEPWENHGVDVLTVRAGRIVALHENNDARLVREHFPTYEEDDA